MRQITTEATTRNVEQLKMARLSSAIPAFLRFRGNRGLPAKPMYCPANPVSEHACPIMDQRQVAARQYRPHKSRNAPFADQLQIGRSNVMSKSLARTSYADAPEMTPSIASAADLQALLGLQPGEAYDSLLAVHTILAAELPKGKLRVYEAGGGSTSFLPSDILCRSEVAVVDIDAEQLRNNDYAQQAIRGDIQTHRFAPDSFDLVTCYNVIEHLPDVGAALTGFFHALKPGGLVLIAAPNPKSLSGVVTKYTPHWFHIWFYRHVLGKKHAGQPGQPPFPTFFHPLVLPARLIAFAEERGMRVMYRREHESPRFPELRTRKPLLAVLLDIFAAAINLLPTCNSDVRRGDYHLILKKR
jgi:SAM-dependent methyltransferase